MGHSCSSSLRLLQAFSLLAGTLYRTMWQTAETYSCICVWWQKNSQGGEAFLASFVSSSHILVRSLSCTFSLSSSLAFILCHYPSLSQLDLPDVPLIRHTNVIRLLYNHPFSRFHALSPNLKHVLWILFHSGTPDYITFHFIYSVFV